MEEEDEEENEVVHGRYLRLRDKSIRRRTKYMSLLRSNTHLEWTKNESNDEEKHVENQSNDNNEMENVKVNEMGLERIEIITPSYEFSLKITKKQK